MTLFNALKSLLVEPAPEYAFELSEAGIAWARISSPQPSFQPVEPGTIVVSPLTENVHKPDELADAVRAITSGSSKKGSRAVLILPDYCARVSVLEFDNFPQDPKEQLSLVRFRMKKSVPFDVESAAIAFHAQTVKGARKAVEVVVVAAALEIVSRYEAPFRAAGLHPGFVTTAIVAMSELNRFADISVLARLNGRTLTIAVMNAGTFNLVRSLELQDADQDEIHGPLFQTIAFVEDHMGVKPARLLHCGFSDEFPWSEHLDMPVAALDSRFGSPMQYNAGLLGYLQSVTGGVKAA